MNPRRFDRKELKFKPLKDRRNKVNIRRDAVPPEGNVPVVPGDVERAVKKTAEHIRNARAQGSAVILAFGAHTIKNGLGPVLIRLMNEGWITHLATNGAGIIHDWEITFQGETSEDVRENVRLGEFGMWEETGLYINLAIAVGAWRGFGYGESLGALVSEQGIDIPEQGELEEEMRKGTTKELWKAAAAADLLSLLRELRLRPGRLSVPHPCREYGVQAAAFESGIPFTGHPMFGCDIIYVHPANMGAAVGRTAERDFLSFAHSVSKLEGGVYLSVGSAVMSPMIFEKSLSMARNVCLQQGGAVDTFAIHVVDLAQMDWDWKKGEPPPTDPAYYLRYLKTFSRMGGDIHYVQADNRVFLPALYNALATSQE